MSHRIFGKEIIPAEHIFLITPHDTNYVNHSGTPTATRGLSFADAGTLRVLTVNDEDVTIPADSLAAGIIHPMAVKMVYATGTTVTGIVGYA